MMPFNSFFYNARSVLSRWKLDGACVMGLLFVFLSPGDAIATDLKYEFNLPSFGGNPGATTYYLNLLDQQKPKFEPDTVLTDTELFEEQLRRRIISAVSAQIVSSIYGGDFVAGDSFIVGDFTILYTDSVESGNVCIEINDGISTTEVCVPAI